jgi:hypothetical protein
MRTEEFEELLLAWMRTVLEHSGFTLVPRFLALEKYFRLEIACKPSAVIINTMSWALQLYSNDPMQPSATRDGPVHL